MWQKQWEVLRLHYHMTQLPNLANARSRGQSSSERGKVFECLDILREYRWVESSIGVLWIYWCRPKRTRGMELLLLQTFINTDISCRIGKHEKLCPHTSKSYSLLSSQLPLWVWLCVTMIARLTCPRELQPSSPLAYPNKSRDNYRSSVGKWAYREMVRM